MSLLHTQNAQALTHSLSVLSVSLCFFAMSLLVGHFLASDVTSLHCPLFIKTNSDNKSILSLVLFLTYMFKLPQSNKKDQTKRYFSSCHYRLLLTSSGQTYFLDPLCPHGWHHLIALKEVTKWITSHNILISTVPFYLITHLSYNYLLLPLKCWYEVEFSF